MIGFAPFGMDATGYSNYPLGAKDMDAAALDAFAAKYAAFADVASAWPRLDAFGGGAHVIDLGARKSFGWTSSHEWLAAALNGEDIDA